MHGANYVKKCTVCSAFFRIYSYICNHSKMNKDFFMIRLKRLYVNTASSFCMIIGC